MRRQQGFTLVELMVATSLSIIVLGGISVVLVTANRSQDAGSELKVLQDRARYAMQQLADDLRMAGYYGCVEDDNPTDAGGPIINKATTNPFAATPLTGQDLAPNDRLSLQYVERLTSLTAGTTTPLDNLTVASAAGLAPGQVVILGNCETADTFVISAVSGNIVSHASSIGNTTDSLSALYPANATLLYRLNSVAYSVRDDPDNNNLPTLFRNDGTNDLALAPGVDSFQVQYGIDNGGDDLPDTYVGAGAVTNWNNVISVRLGLLMRTDQEYGDVLSRDTYPIAVLDTTFADDGLRVRRRTFQTTIFIRNSI